MKILFLGGTGFVGRHMVKAALDCGHHVTLFNRGLTNNDIFPGAERIIGNREGGLDVLKHHRWDAVVDVNGYLPSLVQGASKYLSNNVSKYVFISAGNVYDHQVLEGEVDESAALLKIDNVASKEYWGSDYGRLKVACEKVVQQSFPDRSIILRLGVVAGPYDPTDRVTYWVSRVAQGGDIVIPASPDQKIRVIDARDLAEFTITLLERNLNGVYNTFGGESTWKDWIDACQIVSSSHVNPHWVSDRQFITESIDLQARPFGALPMMPPANKLTYHFHCKKALEAGLVCRSATETASDILSWHQSRNLADAESVLAPYARLRKALDWGERQGELCHWMAGLTMKQEASLLQKWKFLEGKASR